MNKRFSLERKLGWLAFPGLIRAIASLQLVFFVLLFLKPEAADVFYPDPDKVFSGEIWRLVSFIFYPLVDPYSSLGVVFSSFFAYIAMRISFLINDALEDYWGALRTSLFVYGVIVTQAALFLLAPVSFALAGGSAYYLSLFFAFATVQPRYTFYLFFILPVPVWLIAAMGGLTLLADCVRFPLLTPLVLGPHIVYLLWAVPTYFRWLRTRGKVRVRRARFESGKNSATQTLHCCVVCGKTEVSDPELDFRVTANGEEYCLDHLPKRDKGSAP